MKKIFIASSTFLSGFLTLTPIAYATDIGGAVHPATSGNIVDCGSGQFKALCELTGDKFGNAFGQIITFAFIFAIVIALAFLIFGGIKWITSGGEKTGVEEARNHVIAAVVGLIIVFLSYFILNLIVYFFTGVGINNIVIPKLTL